jgi:perosamine synthetase
MDYITLGYNFRMSNITAALGISQLRKINDIITMRRRNAEYMTYRLSKISGMSLPIIPADYFNVYQMYTVVIDGGSQRRDKLLKHLSNKGIMTKVYFHPVHMTRFYKKMGYKCKLPITEMVSGKVLTLPTYPELTKPEMDYIVQEIKNFMPGDDRNGE